MLDHEEREIAARAAERWGHHQGEAVATQWIHHPDPKVAGLDPFGLARWLAADPKRAAFHESDFPPETALALHRADGDNPCPLTGEVLEAAYRDLVTWFRERDREYLLMLDRHPEEVARLLREEP
jgi:hypothetical protein